MSLFCKHTWSLISETTTVSKFENSIKVFSDENVPKHLPHQLVCADRKFIQIVQCTKCGKLKRFVETI